MSDYIKRDDAVRIIRESPFKRHTTIICYFVGSLNELPSADVVEVVRCKDCKWWKPFNDKMGDCGYDMKHKDQYCDRGERADT